MRVWQFALSAGDRWTSQRAIGSPEFLKGHHPSGRRKGIIPLPEQFPKAGKYERGT